MGGSGLGAVKAVLIGAALSVLAVAGVQHGGSARPPQQAAATAVVRQVLDRTRPDARCARLGAPSAVVARQATALVRRPGGGLAVVPFKEGWAVYTHQQPGRFLSLCLGRSRRSS